MRLARGQILRIGAALSVVGLRSGHFNSGSGAHDMDTLEARRSPIIESTNGVTLIYNGLGCPASFRNLTVIPQ